MAKVGLFGAAGAIGKSVAAALEMDGIPYRVVGRSRSALEAAFGNNALAEIATWDPDDAESVRRAARGLETIVYLVGVPYTDFGQHPVVLGKTLEGAIAEGVPQFLLIGTVYPLGLPQTARVREDHPRNAHTFKGKMRARQEELLLEADAAGRIHGAVLRLPDFYGPGVERSLVDGVIQAAAKGGRAQMIGPIDTPHEFVFVPDVGPVVTGLIRETRAFGRVWHLGGVGVITQRQFAEQAFALAGHKPRLFAAGKTILRAVGLFNPLMRELVEMHYLQTNPVIMDDSAIHQLLGQIHKTPYAEGIRQSLAAAGARPQR
jgi:nucleoside-diphosphate-sugar epimerase